MDGNRLTGMEKVGLFGGTFDPIHFGHLNLAVELMERQGLDRILFCPTSKNPLKSHFSQVSAQHRLEMTTLAIQDEPRFAVLDKEVHSAEASYTVDTIEALLSIKSSAKAIKYFLILGFDAAKSFHRWHRAEEIIDLLEENILVGLRKDYIENCKGAFQGPQKITETLEKGLVATRLFDISSTDVRLRLKNGSFCGHLIPAKVLDYIRLNRLYC